MPRQNSLFFSWDKVDDLPDLKRLRMIFDTLADEKIIQHLHSKRGRGRNDYPVWSMLRAVAAGIVLGHDSVQSLVRELNRNPALADICGFNPVPVQKVEKKLERPDPKRRPQAVFLKHPPRYAIPSAWNFSRFISSLDKAEEQHGLITQMFESMRGELFDLLPDFGKHLGYDGKAIQSNSTGQKNKKTGVTSDPDAAWGVHETGSVDARTGKSKKKKKIWFGYGLHIIADTVYEIPVDFRVTVASRSEVKELEGMADELFGSWKSLGERCVEFSADRGLDSGTLKAWFWDEWRIRPLIDTRELWREEKQGQSYDPQEPIRRLFDPEVYDNVRYTEKGSVQCECPKSGKWKKMAFCGFEEDRGCLKFRCPAKAYGFGCEGMEECLSRAGSKAKKYGRVVRVALKTDRRIFTPTPNGSPSWKRGYKRRNAIERINSRLDNDFNFEKHYLRGKGRITARIALSMAIMMGFAVGYVKNGEEEKMRSLVSEPRFLDTG